MANEKQYDILQQGVNVWNQWRKQHPNKRINLSGVNLAGINLRTDRLSGVNLQGADLTKADLRQASLKGAILQGANLHGSLLQGTTLRRTNLRKANLEGAFLEGANLQGANLKEALLQGANLERANLKNVDLRKMNLRGMNFRKATLINVNLEEANLIQADLSEAIITGACLYGTAKDDWIINGIICEYVYWDSDRRERTPKDRDFRPGEFEELYKSLPTFEYYFEQGFTLIEIALMDRIVQAINECQPDIELKLKNFETTGTPHATFTVIHQDHVEAVQQQLIAQYEERIHILEGQKEVLMELFSKTMSGGFHIERVEGNLTVKAGRDITAGNKTLMSHTIDVSGGEVTMGNKQIGRDNINISGHAQVGSLTTGASYHGLTPDETEQHKIRATLQQDYQALNTKVGDLRNAYITETDPAARLHLKTQIEAAEAELSQIGQQLETFDHQQTIICAMIDLIQSLPNLHDSESQSAFLASAGIDLSAHDQIPTGKPPAQFAPLLVSTCAKYGRLHDGRHALAAILETAKQYVGQEKQALCDDLIQQIQTYF